MNQIKHIPRIETGVRNLDALLDGGLPAGSVVVLAGPPGAGKTVLAQQICFHNASPECRVLYFGTLSEPTAKTLRYLSRFGFFDPAKLDSEVFFVDLGVILRSKGLEATSQLVMERVREVKPTLAVIDTFKVFDDLAHSQEELRKFGYEIVVNLMAWECTALLLGEYATKELETNPIFSIVDGLILLTHRELSGEQQRLIQPIKMRGTEHSRDAHPFLITSRGIEVFAPRVTIRREDSTHKDARCKTAISKLDGLLGQGIPLGSSLLVSGVAGTGKTLLLLELVYRGAKAGEKGLFFSFEETRDRLLAVARELGWDIDREIERGMIDIVFIPQPEIVVEAHLLMIEERIAAMRAQRVSIDSVSVFLHKLRDPQTAREKVFQLASVIQNAQAVGFFATDIPYGSNQISRFGVEETVVDGVILLTSVEEGFERHRYLEIYKLRNTAHLKGRHSLSIGHGGIAIFPRYDLEVPDESLPPTPAETPRLGSGIHGLDALLGGGLLDRSVTFVSGSAGAGKTTLALQFIAEGLQREQAGLYVALEESPGQILMTAERLGVQLHDAVERGQLVVIDLSREHARPNEFLAILSDRIHSNQVRRLVLDGASHLIPDKTSHGDQRQLLQALVARFRSLGVTSLLTLEDSSLYSSELATGRGISAVADNLITLRYSNDAGLLRPTITVVKTRGSRHERGTYFFDIAQGGIRMGRGVASASFKRAAATTGRKSTQK